MMKSLRTIAGCLVIILLVMPCHAPSVEAQDGQAPGAPEDAGDQDTEAESQEQRTAWQTYQATLNLANGVVNFVFTTIMLLLFALVLLLRIRYWKKLNRKIERELRGIKLPKQTAVDESRNSTILLGIGGTGKTTLIRSLFNDPRANPNIKTAKYAIYSKSEEVPAETPAKRCVFYISDYRGQNLGDLIRAFVEQQIKPYSEMRYGHINSLVLIVDLVKPPASQGNHAQMVNSYDEERVLRHLQEWNDQALDAVFGMMTDELKYACLFINKYDLIEDHTVEMEANIKRAFGPLRDALEERCDGVNFDVLIGSARNGDKVTELHRSLTEYSVRSPAKQG